MTVWHWWQYGAQTLRCAVASVLARARAVRSSDATSAALRWVTLNARRLSSRATSRRRARCAHKRRVFVARRADLSPGVWWGGQQQGGQVNRRSWPGALSAPGAYAEAAFPGINAVMCGRLAMPSTRGPNAEGCARLPRCRGSLATDVHVHTAAAARRVQRRQAASCGQRSQTSHGVWASRGVACQLRAALQPDDGFNHHNYLARLRMNMYYYPRSSSRCGNIATERLSVHTRVRMHSPS